MTERLILGIALSSIVAVAVAPVSWTLPIVVAGVGGMVWTQRARRR